MNTCTVPFPSALAKLRRFINRLIIIIIIMMMMMMMMMMVMMMPYFSSYSVHSCLAEGRQC